MKRSTMQKRRYAAAVTALFLAFLLLAGCVAGIVLLVKHRRFFRLADGQDLLRPGDRFLLPFLRPGWILFFFGTLALMILALF